MAIGQNRCKILAMISRSGESDLSSPRDYTARTTTLPPPQTQTPIMSSQTMAATMVGRRDHDPTDRSMLGFSDSVSDFVDVDVSSGTAPAFHPSTIASSDRATNTSLQTANQDQDKDERNAISNLLAQLSRNSNPQQLDISVTNHSVTSTSMEIATQAPLTGQPSMPFTEQDIIQRAYIVAKDTVMSPNSTERAAAEDHTAITHHLLPPLETQLWNTTNPASNNFFHATTSLEEKNLGTTSPAIPPPATGDSLYRHNSTSALEQDPLRTEDLPETLDDSAKRGQVEAYAKLEFADGVYYITTHSCELGRDVRAYNKAKDRKAKSLQSSHGAKSGGSSDKASRPSKRSRKEGGSLVKRSVVSEKGGFCGMDDSGAEEDVQQQRKETVRQTHSSQPSETSIVKPQDLDLNVPLPTFDYQHYASLLNADDAVFEDDEQPAPVTSEHLPPPKNSNPLVPIHHTITETVEEELKNHTSISRRHLRIEWDYKNDCWKARVLGRNGAFIDNKYLAAGSVGILKHGSKIQIAAVEATFKLPQTMIDNTTDESEAEEEVSPSMNKQSATPPSEEGAMSMSPSKVVGARTKIHLKLVKKSSLPQAAVPVNADGQPMPQKKRGPGRPPKDGVMSNRERREIARAIKAAEAKEANGGVTPPPTGRAKPIRPPVKPEVADPTKPEKRKYTKRKRAETDDILPSIEGEDADAAGGSDDEARATRKARPSRSRSPDYPPKESLTEDQLAKPPDNYARLIYDILIDIHPRELGLRQIYRELKKKWPYFVHVVQTEGWQSSVRHNLNSEHEKLFEKGQKDGKGWAWRAIKGAMEPKEELEKKRKAQAAAAAAKANANNMPNGPRYPPQGPPRPGQQWQPQQGQMFMYPGMPPNVTGHPQPFYPPPMPPHGVPWQQPYPQGPGPGPPQSVPLRGGTGPPPFPPNQPGQPWPYPANGHPPPGAVQMFERPIRPPPSNQNSQQRGAASSGSPNLERPPSPGTMLAKVENAKNPCSAQGMLILARFIDAIVKEYKSEQDKVRSREVFEITKRVVLHEAPEPSFTADSDKEMFGPMIEFVRNIAKDYPNPDFVRRPVEAGDGRKGLEAEGADEENGGDGDGNEDVEMEGNEKEAEQDQDSEAENGDGLESRTASPMR
jgi:hypothetical protein